MPFCNGNTYRTLGWLIAVCLCFGITQFPALGQAPPVKDAESEAVPKPPDHQNESQAERPKADKPKPSASNGIAEPVDPNTTKPKASPSDTKAKDELRDIARRDLTAQQIMAKFTRQLAAAGWIALVITGSGIFLIWRTLVHTRRAAKAAEDMVCEARKTTEAAIDAAQAAHRQADAAILLEAARFVFVEAYLMPMDGGMIQNDGIPQSGLVVGIDVQNIGKTDAFPQHFDHFWAVSEISPTQDIPEFTREFWNAGTVAAADRTLRFTCNDSPIVIDAGAVNDIREKQKFLWAYISIAYRDWFGIERAEDFILQWNAPNGAGGVRHGFSVHYHVTHPDD